MLLYFLKPFASLGVLYRTKLERGSPVTTRRFPDLANVPTKGVKGPIDPVVSANSVIRSMGKGRYLATKVIGPPMLILSHCFF